jgi:hypothetical protein
MTVTMIAVLMMAVPAMADTCEADGEQGLTTAWGECMTPSLYDERFSFETLDATPSVISGQEDISIAELYGVVDDTPTERLIGVGLVETPRTFTEIVWWGITGPVGPH